MKHGSLFSGIGGFDLAASWMGWENIFQVEIDPFCTKILEKHFPKTERYKDINEFDGTKYKGSIDIISGGFPCQPFSQAGKRKGTNDDRYLWPQMLRVISEVKPAFVVGENVAGLLSMENGRIFERILIDLENKGFRIETFVIPACAIGAWHRRDRVWIVAYNKIKKSKGQIIGDICTKRDQFIADSDNPRDGTSTNEIDKNRQAIDKGQTKQSFDRIGRYSEDVPDTNKQGLQGHGEHGECTGKCPAWKVYPKQIGTAWQFEPSVGRVVHGLSGRVDRLKALGNAIVPQVAYEIFKAIEQTF